MYAKKANRQYTITEGEKDTYIALGYDIYDDKGKLISHGAGKTVSFVKYQEALKLIEELNAKLDEVEKKLEEAERKVKNA